MECKCSLQTSYSSKCFKKSFFVSIIFNKLPLLQYFYKELNKMAAKLNLDKLDYQIIQHMMEDAEISYADLGKKLFVSGGTIHVRIKKLQEMGVVDGTRLHVNTRRLGYNVIAFVGIFLEKSSLYDSVFKDLMELPEVVRINYTTGNYAMFIEIACRDIDQLRFVLHDQMQRIKGIERTETLISLEESLNRNIQVSPDDER